MGNGPRMGVPANPDRLPLAPLLLIDKRLTQFLLSYVIADMSPIRAINQRSHSSP